MQPTVNTPEATEPAEALELADLKVSPVIAASQAAFAGDLPRLLEERPGQWVAYQGQRQLGFGRSKTELYQQCLRLGFRVGEFVVRRIRPQATSFEFGSFQAS